MTTITATLKALIGIIALTLLVAAALLFVVNAIALTFWPTWAVRQVWCLIDEERMVRRFALYNIEADPNEWHHRPFGMFLLLSISLGIKVLFGSDRSPFYLQAIWSCWVYLIATLIVLQGFAWTFRPRWLARKYPSMTASFTSSKAGRIATRITGVLLLLIALLIVSLATFG